MPSMEKTCANHPESLALASCKACEKAICLMCVHDEREGTFCSEDCIRNFREVSDWVGTGTETEGPPASPPAPAPAAASSVFEEMPERPATVVETPSEPPPAEEPPPPEPEPEPVPAAKPATKTIGNPCYQHSDIRAKAFCTRCRRPICGLCIVENPTGMFCSDECAKNQRGRRGSPGLLKVAGVLVLLAGAAGAVYAVKPELFQPILGGTPSDVTSVETPPPPTPPAPPTPEPPKPQPPKEVVKTPEPPKPAPEPPKKPDVVTPPDAPAETGPVETVKVTKAPPPRPEAPKPTRFVVAWGHESPGAWYRIRTMEGGKSVFTDVGLKDRDADACTLIVQKHAGGKGGAVAEQREPNQTVVLLGEERLRLDDRDYLCEIREPQEGGSRQWVLMQGRHAGAVLRSEGPDGSFIAERLWENPVRVGDRVFDCLVVEGTIGNRRVKTWYSPAFPLNAVRLEIDGETVSQAVLAGDSWTARPAPK